MSRYKVLQIDTVGHLFLVDASSEEEAEQKVLMGEASLEDSEVTNRVFEFEEVIEDGLSQP